jgi:hypothetical protein
VSAIAFPPIGVLGEEARYAAAAGQGIPSAFRRMLVPGRRSWDGLRALIVGHASSDASESKALYEMKLQEP